MKLWYMVKSLLVRVDNVKVKWAKRILGRMLIEEVTS